MGLDSSSTRPTDSHLPALVQKSAGDFTDNSKPDIVVTILGIVVVASSRTAISWFVVPGAAPFTLPTP
jgi:hypothetical protein